MAECCLPGGWFTEHVTIASCHLAPFLPGSFAFPCTLASLLISSLPNSG